MIKIYADGADLKSILELNQDPKIEGFTTNPTLMKASGVTDYKEFAKEVLAEVKEKPVSFEVFGDTHTEIIRQAEEIASWGDNVYVKIPIMNTKKIPNTYIMNELAKKGIKVNATAITTLNQIHETVKMLWIKNPSIISIFAGRIADTGINPTFYFNYASLIKHESQQILWASTREIYNYVMAKESGADIITMPSDIIKKMQKVFGMELYEMSYETVKMFYDDAKKLGYTI